MTPSMRGLTFQRFIALASLSVSSCAAAASSPYFVIHVLDEQTNRGVPLVELETVHHVAHVTDSAGVIALHEPELMDREAYFHVTSHGYVYPKDALGFRGVKLTPRAGESVTIRVRRENIAERLYRITGAGIYRDSVLAGLPVPLREPVLNARVLGQDTVIVTPYRGKLFWFWGDTDQLGYPLGNFAASGATSELPADGGLRPDQGINLTYFTKPDGFAKAMCPDFGPGLHWIESVFTVRDERGIERLAARVSSQKGLVPPHAWHLAVFNDETQVFEPKTRLNISDMHDAAHPFRAKVDGLEYLYLYPNFRVRADLGSVSDPAQYESFTCLAGDGKFRDTATELDRDERGRPRYHWKRDADRLDHGRVDALIKSHLLKPAEAWLRVRDVESGKDFMAGRGSVFWNEYRQRWIMIMAPAPGEVWFGEADTPTGPWGYVRRIVSHADYNFYNVTQHPFFDEDGRFVYFEGTYTASFSAAKTKTPRYDYNQIMYRLALDDERLCLPRPVYALTSDSRSRLVPTLDAETAASIESVPFFALPADCTRPGVVAIRRDGAGRLAADVEGGEIVFTALPARSPLATGVAGKWIWHVTDQENNEVQLAITVSETADGLRIASEDGKMSGTGRKLADELAFRVMLDDHAYELSARRFGEGFRGTWARDDRGVSGTWTAERVDSSPPEFRSPDVVPLFAFHDRARDRWLYSVDPDFAPKGFVRAADPICRVWRNPHSILILDRERIRP